MKYKYKKLLYLLGLTSMLTLNGCHKENSEISTEISTGNVEENSCNHLDENSLNVKTLSDGSKYVSASNFFYSARENFLNNNRIIEMEGVDDTYNDFLNKTDYLSLFSNPVIQDTLNSSECKGHIRYSENTDDNSVMIDIETAEYDLFINSYLANFEIVQEKFTRENVIFDKYLNAMKSNNKYFIDERYILSSTNLSELNKIDVLLKAGYEFDFNENIDEIYNCTNFFGSLNLNSSMNKMEAKIDEETFYELTNLLATYAKEDKSVEQFLEENDELMKEMFGLEYEMFIEDAKAVSYTLTKPVN